MRLLFDANISHKLVERLADLFPDSAHVSSARAAEGWRPQRVGPREGTGLRNRFEDEDFHQLALLEGPPPRVIWVRLGNCSTDVIEQVLREAANTIDKFAAEDEASFLVLGS